MGPLIASKGYLDRIRKTVIKTMPDGTRVSLDEVADVFESDSPNMINRENMQRRFVVQANARGRDLNSIIKERIIKQSIFRTLGYCFPISA